MGCPACSQRLCDSWGRECRRVAVLGYCHSGRTTGEQCGHTAVSTNAQSCTETGCAYPLIALKGGTMVDHGDSGSPVYAKNSSGAYIRCHVTSRSSTTSYAELYTLVAATYGTTIVTG